jgi:hypothetical protein
MWILGPKGREADAMLNFGGGLSEADKWGFRNMGPEGDMRQNAEVSGFESVRRSRVGNPERGSSECLHAFVIYLCPAFPITVGRTECLKTPQGRVGPPGQPPAF